MNELKEELEKFKQEAAASFEKRLQFCQNGELHDYHISSAHIELSSLVEQAIFTCSKCGYKMSKKQPTRDAYILIDALAEAIARKLNESAIKIVPNLPMLTPNIDDET